MVYYPRPAWQPGFRRLSQALPAIAPVTAAAPTSGNGGRALLATGAGLIVLGAGALGTLFTYGIARSTKDGLVKTTGYILAGLGALVTLIETAGVVGIVAMSGTKK